MSSMTIAPASTEETAEIIREHIAELEYDLTKAETAETKSRTQDLIDKWKSRLDLLATSRS